MLSNGIEYHLGFWNILHVPFLLALVSIHILKYPLVRSPLMSHNLIIIPLIRDRKNGLTPGERVEKHKIES